MADFSSSTPARPDLMSTPSTDRWLLTIAVGTIALSLVLLVIIPVAVEQRIANLGTGRLEAVDLAQQETYELAFALARETALLRGYIGSGDSEFLRDYVAMRTRENEAIRRLDALQEQLPGLSQDGFGEVRQLAQQWHLGVEQELRARAATGQPFGLSERQLDRDLYERTLSALGDFSESLEGHRSNTMLAVRRAERVGLVVNISLAVLVLLSTALVLWLARRVRRYADQARRAHADVIRANESRTRLMRGFSHDLKNPLSVAMLTAEMLKRGFYGGPVGEQGRAIGRIHLALEQSLSLLHDLVELSKAEGEDLDLKSSRLDLERLLHGIADEYSDAAATAGLTLRVSGAEEGLEIEADARRVRQILDNLVGNAINYTPSGGEVILSTEKSASGPSSVPGDWIGLSVRDTGPGIPPAQLETVFEEFVRLPGRAGVRGGTGVGLAISRQLARRMQGDISLQSTEGGGSTFTFWLPLTPDEQQGQAASRRQA